MALYSKFLKDLLTKKGKYIHSDNIMVEGNYSTVIQRILPPKYKDPGSVTIPCSIGVVSVGWVSLVQVVRKEVLKLLEAGFIYPISDSAWRHMMTIFADMVEKCIEVFMDEFSVFGSSFDCCLANLE
ncbi:uncharacterized protein LOC114396992 [Glycine soja]|uniref:uncharacterized protein LOC114396992 n=1 Tax=Glycine soja TaxID=3848 RepID=UPI00103D6D25|nr:uncharacterized protein LOC114396992 [Glycine soja]